MPIFRLVCPACSGELRFKAPRQPSAVLCTHCDHEIDLEGGAPTSRSPRPARSRRPQRAAYDDDYDDYDYAPKRRRSGGGNGAVIGLAIGGGVLTLLLLVGGGVAIFFATRSSTSVADSGPPPLEAAPNSKFLEQAVDVEKFEPAPAAPAPPPKVVNANGRSIVVDTGTPLPGEKVADDPSALAAGIELKPGELRLRYTSGGHVRYSLRTDLDAPMGHASMMGNVYLSASPNPPKAEPSSEGSATGTGFVIDEAGHILTCNHVIENAKSIKVTLGDRPYTGTVVAREPLNDLALVKVDVAGIEPLPVTLLGDVRKGQAAFALGFPIANFVGSDLKITRGIVSGFSDRGEFGHVVQTDCTINGGNSGGPLLDARGAVVGVNSFKVTLKNVDGVNFAIAPDSIRRFLREHEIRFRTLKSGPELNSADLYSHSEAAIAKIECRVDSSGAKGTQRFDLKRTWRIKRTIPATSNKEEETFLAVLGFIKDMPMTTTSLVQCDEYGTRLESEECFGKGMGMMLSSRLLAGVPGLTNEAGGNWVDRDLEPTAIPTEGPGGRLQLLPLLMNETVEYRAVERSGDRLILEVRLQRGLGVPDSNLDEYLFVGEGELEFDLRRGLLTSADIRGKVRSDRSDGDKIEADYKVRLTMDSATSAAPPQEAPRRVASRGPGGGGLDLSGLPPELQGEEGAFILGLILGAAIQAEEQGENGGSRKRRREDPLPPVAERKPRPEKRRDRTTVPATDSTIRQYVGMLASSRSDIREKTIALERLSEVSPKDKFRAHIRREMHELLQSPSDFGLFRATLDCLAVWGLPEDKYRLKPLLDHRDMIIREELYGFLAETQDPEVARWIADEIAEDPDEASHVVEKLAEMGKVAEAPATELLLPHENPNVRKAGCTVLGICGGARARVTLREALESESDSSVKKAIEEALDAIEDRQESL